jgi:hypothetical protein
MCLFAIGRGKQRHLAGTICEYSLAERHLGQPWRNQYSLCDYSLFVGDRNLGDPRFPLRSNSRDTLNWSPFKLCTPVRTFVAQFELCALLHICPLSDMLHGRIIAPP